MRTKNFTAYKKHLTKLMGGTEDQHFNFILNEGLEWIDNYFNPYSEFTKELSKWWSTSSAFWNWYKLQHNVRCYEIIISMGFDLDIHSITNFQRAALIECFNEVTKKAKNIYPGMPIMAKIQNEIKAKEVEYA